MKVAELEGALLDYWVGRAYGLDAHELRRDASGTSYVDRQWGVGNRVKFSPSTDWAQAGQFIEREKIAFWPGSERESAKARKIYADEAGRIFLHIGATPLIAIMRTYVDSKFGEEVPDSAN